MDSSLPGSSAPGILQARILEWVAMAFSRISSQPRDQTRVSWIAGRFFIMGLPGILFAFGINVTRNKQTNKKTPHLSSLLLWQWPCFHQAKAMFPSRGLQTSGPWPGSCIFRFLCHAFLSTYLPHTYNKFKHFIPGACSSLCTWTSWGYLFLSCVANFLKFVFCFSGSCCCAWAFSSCGEQGATL